MVAGALFLALAYFAVGQAAAARNDAQGAADAAALAAANDARQQLGLALLDNLSTPELLPDVLDGLLLNQAGACAEAQRFASMNGADLDGCGRSAGLGGGFTVDVTSRTPVGDTIIPGTGGQYATASATAALEPRCRLRNAAGDGEEREEGEREIVELTCQGEDVVVDPERPKPLPELDELFTVRLVD